jgi:hypothetical protein
MARISLLAVSALVALAAACRPGSRAAGEGDPVVAIVNGVSISADELRLEAARGNPHQGGAPVSAVEGYKNVRETIIRKELAAQRAVALGLDSDPAYVEERRRMEAQLAVWRRQKLADLLHRSAAAKRRSVSDEEARRYFDENQQLLRAELHIEQLLVRSEPAVRAARQELAAGASFEQVFAKYVGPAPAAVGKPWDLGFLPWMRVPEPWRPVLQGLETGALSEVIRGPKNRFWVIRVTQRRENQALRFEDLESQLVDFLSTSAQLEAREALDRELRAAARIEYRDLSPALAEPKAAGHDAEE